MSTLDVASLAKISHLIPRNAIRVLPDSDRYKFPFEVPSESSDAIYRISFDAAEGCLCWKCSCRSGIRYGYCKHLRSCGLKGRGDMKPGEGLLEARRLGIIL